jgi:hypothetical protein
VIFSYSSIIVVLVYVWLVYPNIGCFLYFALLLCNEVTCNLGWFMAFNATFNKISVILVSETGLPEENHWPVASHWQTLSHNVVLSTQIFVIFSYSSIIVVLVYVWLVYPNIGCFLYFALLLCNEVTCNKSVVFSGYSGFLHQ